MYKEMDINKAFLALESGPVILIGSRFKGKDNLMTISWQMPNEFSGTIAITTGDWNYSFKGIMENKACTIMVPDSSMIETVVKIGAVSGRDCDKFQMFNLKKESGKIVSSPIIEGCLCAFECEVLDYIEKYSILILKVVRALCDESLGDKRVYHAIGDGRFTLDGETINLRSLMEDKLPLGV